jgi:hypothetical protein
MRRRVRIGAVHVALFATWFASLGSACTHTDSASVAADDAGPAETPDEADAAPSPAPVPAPATLYGPGGSACAPVPLTTRDRWADACWVDGTGKVCGVDASQLPGGDHGPAPTCVPQDAPGKASTYCGKYFDQIDALLRDAQGHIARDAAGIAQRDPARVDDALTLPTEGGLTFVFEGCCLPSGECGASLRQPRPLGPDKSLTLMAFDGAPFDFHLGCVSARELTARLLGSEDEIPVYTDLTQLPYCDYAADEPAAPMAGRIPHVPAFLCGCGEGLSDDGRRPLGCLHGLAESVCGEDAPIGADLADYTETLCGCGREVRGDGNCFPYTDSDLCGAQPYLDGVFSGLPSDICGCGEDIPARGGPCVSNVPQSVCGDIPPGEML